jgi:hypothetical protein
MSQAVEPGTLLLAGLAAGVAQVAAGVAMYLAGVYFAPWSMGVSVLVLLVSIAAGIWWYAGKTSGGTLSFSQAVLAGVVISISTGVIYAFYNLVSITWLYPGFLDEMVRAQMAAFPDARSFEARRATVSALMIAIPNLVRLSIIGSVLSLPIGFLLSRRGGSPVRPQVAV